MKRWIVVVALVACGGRDHPQTEGGPRCRAMPTDSADRRALLADLGRRLYADLAAGAPRRILYDDDELVGLLEPDALERARAVRVAPLDFDVARLASLHDAEPLSLCIQGGAEAQRGQPPFALAAPAWVFERALVAGSIPGGRRIAVWVEGTFVLSDRGFSAIALRRVEDPRWEHSDLELATCDVRVEIGTPQDVAVVTE